MLTLQPYGVVLALAGVVSYLVAKYRLKRYQLTNNDLDNLYLFIVPLALIGARIYHVIDKLSYYQENPGEIIAVWNGGLGIYGALAGGLVGILGLKIYMSYKSNKTYQKDKYELIKVFDFLIPSVAIAQAIGRWGNFFNLEVFGGPTNLPWGWYIPSELRPAFWKNYSYFHPTFAYESLWAFVGFLALLMLERKFYVAKKTPTLGLLTGFYCVWYGVGRFALEFLRFDTAEFNGVKIAQVISVGLILVGIWLMKRVRKRFA
ncbi:prolipoprotein diacylglyceryl transferase [Candidatus Microgenomates bacterium]|nr:prolipoprotein diacylglyceryl transferase [Candidatus Microgenomates bacterium]